MPNIGANVGHYTKRFSDLVRPRGRVIAIEPVPAAFSLSAANFRQKNVALLNVAASDRFAEVGIRIPSATASSTNHYRATITAEEPDVTRLAVTVDSLGIETPNRLIKIDAEGHNSAGLRGERGITERDSPMQSIPRGGLVHGADVSTTQDAT